LLQGSGESTDTLLPQISGMSLELEFELEMPLAPDCLSVFRIMENASRSKPLSITKEVWTPGVMGLMEMGPGPL
jgi:hypothetical protein